MRAKNLWRLVPSESYVRLLYARITHTRYTTSYFFLALALCLIQIVLLSVSYSEHSVSLEFIRKIISRSGLEERFAVVEAGELWVCDSYQTLQSGGPAQCRSLTAQGIENDVPLRIDLGDGRVSDLTLRCVEALSWPDRLLRDASREDLALLAFQVWLFMLSAVAIVNESIPHLVAAFISHAIHTGWVAFQFPRWQKFYSQLDFFVNQDACGDIDLLPGFWEKRLGVLAPTLALSAVSLLAVAFISVKLFTVYVKHVFERVDASQTMNQLYKTVMTFTVFMQLSAFFVLVSTALWVDELLTGMMSKYAQHLKIYLAVFGIASFLDLAWIVLGYNSIRRECKYRSAGFLAIGVIIIAVWSFMFASRLYRWTFSTWPFFAALTVMSFIYLVITILLAIACRANFGKGLAPYLQTQVTYDNVDFDPVSPKAMEAGYGREDDEKMDFYDVPITITAPDAVQKSDSSFQSSTVEQSILGAGGRLSKSRSAVKSRSSWTTLLDSYTFKFVPSQSQQQTRDEPQLPTSYEHRPSFENNSASRNAQSQSSSYQVSLGKDSYGGFALTWDELMGYKSEGDRNSTILPTMPLKSASIRRDREKAPRADAIDNSKRVVGRVSEDNSNPVTIPPRAAKVTRFANPIRKGGALPNSPRANLPYF